jgi:uncharacterized protein YecE (DUF72 family)
MAELRVGTSGYQYDHWRGRFYPEDLPKKRWFDYYTEQFDTVEINNTFYNLPKAETFDHWREEAPPGFIYTLKYSRFGTHIKRLKDPETHVDRFVERASRLREALGPILVQLPPRWHAVPERLSDFLEAAPSEHRWAIEFRDPSWFEPGIYDILRRHGVAMCVHDMLEDHPREITADWVYLRFHGPTGDYGGSYSPQALSGAARRIRRHLDEGRDVYVYFNNDAEGCAVDNARDLRRYVLDS